MPNTTPRMQIAETPSTRKAKEVKIRLSHDMCVRLHSRKILDGITIAETISEALQVYFAQLRAAGPLPTLDGGEGHDDGIAR